MLKKGILLGLVLCSLTSIIAQNTGGIIGVVVDATTGRELIGITIKVTPSGKSDISDVEGRFIINELQAGAYSVDFSGPNYKSTNIPLVKVIPSELTVLTVSLVDSVKTVSGILITGKRVTQGNTAGLANERKNSSNIVDGIASDLIKRTPDRSSAEVMRRISGVSLQENKFPVIRGLADRYNTALINGVPMPSTLPDKKAFAFDVIPSSFLDNILVVKTGSPEIPGEFAGGVIQINTRDVPDESSQTVTLGFGGLSNTIGKEVLLQSNTGFGNSFGFGGSYRDLPTGMPAAKAYANLNSNDQLAFSKSFTNDWALRNVKSIPTMQFQYANSSRFLFMNKETGMLIALSYSNIQKLNNIARNDFDSLNKTKEYEDLQTGNNIILGAMLNFSMKLNKFNKLSIRNIFSNNTTEENNLRTGTSIEGNFNEKSYNLNYLQNLFFGTQIAGEHFVKSNDLKFKWTVGLQNVKRNSPDNRRLLYTRPADDTTYPYQAGVGPGKSLTNAGKLYINNNENVRFAAYSLIKGFYGEKVRTDIRIGGFHQGKSRNFDARVLTIVDGSSSVDENLKKLSYDKIFSPSNFSATGFKYDEIIDGTYIYTGTQQLHSGYAMMDNVFGHFIRLTGGARFEHFNQEMLTSKGSAILRPTLTTNSLLPSAALTFLLTSKANLRFAYSSTVARPDFREISPFQYFDFVNFVSVEGNPNLKTTNIQNLDFRIEKFPGDGQSISLGAFYKKFTNPIEQTIKRVINGGYRSVSFANAPEATLMGAELEFRYKLNKLSNQLKNFIIFGNAALIKSEVTVNGRTRAMQGQSPYILNGGVLYTSKKNKFSLSMNYNLVGPRIFSVGSNEYPDFYEIQRHVIDFQIGKGFGKRAEIKLNIGDVLAQSFKVYQNKDNNIKFDASKDRLMNDMNTGRLLMLNFSYKIK